MIYIRFFSWNDEIDLQLFWKGLRIPHHFWPTSTIPFLADEIPVGLTKNVGCLFSWSWWSCKSLEDCTNQLIFFVDLGLATLARSVFSSNSKRRFFQKDEDVFFTSTCVIVRLLDLFFEKHKSPIWSTSVFSSSFFLCFSTCVFNLCFFFGWTFWSRTLAEVMSQPIPVGEPKWRDGSLGVKSPNEGRMHADSFQVSRFVGWDSQLQM